jgi:hypothetical protein
MGWTLVSAEWAAPRGRSAARAPLAPRSVGRRVATAEVEVPVNEDSEPDDLTRGAGFGRGGGVDSLAARREAAQRRLSSSLRQAEMVERAVRVLDEQLIEYSVPDDNGSLHATARALLTIAYGAEAYDVTFVPTTGEAAVRVRHTEFGLEAEVVEPPSAPKNEAVPTGLPKN